MPEATRLVGVAAAGVPLAGSLSGSVRLGIRDATQRVGVDLVMAELRAMEASLGRVSVTGGVSDALGDPAVPLRLNTPLAVIRARLSDELHLPDVEGTFEDLASRHILASDEVTAWYQAGSAAVLRLDTIITDYSNTTSDHRPVVARFDTGG